MHVLVKI